MTARILLILLAAINFTASAEAGLTDTIGSFFTRRAAPKPPSIRILVTDDAYELDLAINGPYRIYDPRTGNHVITRKIGKRDMLRTTGEGIKWGEEFPGVHQIQIIPAGGETVVTVNDVDYEGSVYIYDVQGRLSVVNSLDLEDFLSNVLAPMFQKPESEEVLAAVAITARTNAYFLAENPRNPYWAINAEQVGYGGINKNAQTTAIDEAIRDTRYMVMSRTGAYEGITTPFPAQWKGGGGAARSPRSVVSQITLEEAAKLADGGENAAQILSKAFPGSNIQLIYNSPGSSK